MHIPWIWKLNDAPRELLSKDSLIKWARRKKSQQSAALSQAGCAIFTSPKPRSAPNFNWSIMAMNASGLSKSSSAYLFNHHNIMFLSESDTMTDNNRSKYKLHSSDSLILLTSMMGFLGSFMILQKEKEFISMNREYKRATAGTYNAAMPIRS